MGWRTRGRVLTALVVSGAVGVGCTPAEPTTAGRPSGAEAARLHHLATLEAAVHPGSGVRGFELELSSIDWACAYDLCITTTTTARPTTSTTRPTTTTTNPWEVIADWCTSGLCDEVPPGPPPQNTQDTVPYPTGDYTNPGDIQGPVNTAPTTTVPVVIMPAP